MITIITIIIIMIIIIITIIKTPMYKKIKRRVRGV